MAPSSKLDVAGMTSSCLMRQSKCGWKVVNQMPKTTPIDFLAYKKRIGINHQQLEICGVGFTPFPSISTKIWCDGICRTNMHQRWYDFFWLCRTMGPNVITSWPEKQQLIISIVMSIFSVPNAMQKHMLPENCPFDLNTAPIALGCHDSACPSTEGAGVGHEMAG